MKKKYLAAILGVMMAATSVTACGAATTEKTTSTAENSDDKDAEDTTADSADSDNSDSSADADKESSDKEDSDEEDVTYGEVKSVEDGKITIAVGTMKEMDGNGGAPGGEQGEAPEKPDSDESGNAFGDSADENSKAPGGEQGEAPSMLDLTGDEMTVTVTDDTVITKESTGGPGGAPDGNNSQNETIELSDIQEGDIVAITTDDDGNALTIKVQSADMGGGQ